MSVLRVGEQRCPPTIVVVRCLGLLLWRFGQLDCCFVFAFLFFVLLVLVLVDVLQGSDRRFRRPSCLLVLRSRLRTSLFALERFVNGLVDWTVAWNHRLRELQGVEVVLCRTFSEAQYTGLRFGSSCILVEFDEALLK